MVSISLDSVASVVSGQWPGSESVVCSGKSIGQGTSEEVCSVDVNTRAVGVTESSATCDVDSGSVDGSDGRGAADNVGSSSRPVDGSPAHVPSSVSPAIAGPRGTACSELSSVVI